MEDKFVINIGRSLGSGGRAIGKILAQEFQIAYYDKEILTRAAQESGLCPEIFEQKDEQKGFFRSVLSPLGLFYHTGASLYYGNHISADALFKLQSDAMRRAAEEQSCLFIGRCADYVMRDHPRAVSVFVAADRSDRVERLCSTLHVDANKAEHLIDEGDKARADFYNFYSPNPWGVASTYDLCINSSVLGIEESARFVHDFIVRKLHL